MKFWGWILRALVVVSGIGLILLQSQSVKKSLLETLLNQPFQDSSLRIEVGTVRGLFPFQFHVSSLDLKDGNQTLASLPDISAVWQVPALLALDIEFSLKRGEQLEGDLVYKLDKHALYTHLQGTGVPIKHQAALTAITVDLPSLDLLKGQVKATFYDGYGPTALSLQLEETSAECLKIHDIKLLGDGISGTGHGTFYSPQNIWEGQAELSIASLARYENWLQEGLAGSGHVRIHKTTQNLVEFDLRLQNAQYGALAAKSFNAQGKQQAGNPEGSQADGHDCLEIKVNGDDIVMSGITLPRVSGGGVIGKESGTFNLMGGEDRNISFKADGNIGFSTPAAPQTRITLNQAELRHPLHKILLRQPVTLQWDGRGIQATKLALKTGDGLITVEGLLIGNELKGEMKIDRLPLTALRVINKDWIASGHLSGKGNLQGTKDRPEARLALAGQGLHWQGAAKRPKPFPGVALSGDFALADSVLAWQLKMSCKGRVNIASAGKVTVNKWFPAPDSAGEATLKGQGDLDVISLFIDSGDLIRGQALINLTAEGTLASPQFKGTVAIKNGIYENAPFGTHIKNIRLQGSAAGSVLTLSRISGEDAAKGHIQGQGTIRFASLLNPEIDLRLKFEKMMLVQNDEVTAKAGGNLKIAGILGAGQNANARMTGDIALQPLEVRLDHHPSRVATIKLLEKKKDGAYQTLADHDRQELKDKGPALFDLDIRISSPKHIYLRGYGLDSQWKGIMQVAGTAAEPSLGGEMTLIRGKFDLLGKPLKLSEGRITFSSDVKNDPLLHVVGAREIADVTAMMRVEGRASSPRITFASAPALPQEEVLARLIFGKGLESISVTQTLLLANALTSFKSSNDLNFTDKIRSAFGLDTLEFKEKQSPEGEDSKSGSQMVSVGKRVSDKVYLSLDQSVSGDGGPTATVQYDVTRNLKIEADVGGDKNSGCGFSWIKRY